MLVKKKRLIILTVVFLCILFIFCNNVRVRHTYIEIGWVNHSYDSIIQNLPAQLRLDEITTTLDEYTELESYIEDTKGCKVYLQDTILNINLDTKEINMYSIDKEVASSNQFILKPTWKSNNENEKIKILTFKNIEAIEKLRSNKIKFKRFTEFKEYIQLNREFNIITEEDYISAIVNILNNRECTEDVIDMYFTRDIIKSESYRYLLDLGINELYVGKSAKELLEKDRIITFIDKNESNIEVVILKLDSKQIIYDIDIY